jgi:hypothetical protein
VADERDAFQLAVFVATTEKVTAIKITAQAVVSNQPTEHRRLGGARFEEIKHFRFRGIIQEHSRHRIDGADS